MTDAYQAPPRAGVTTYLALGAVTTVWALGAWWSFAEQRAFAAVHRFDVPELLPLIIDGMAVAMALVAYSASLDARPAVGARAGTAVAVAVSAASNGLWARERSHGDVVTVGVAVLVPVMAMIAFEVLLREVRRQVQRRRGDAAPVRLPMPPLVRWVFAPWKTLIGWRRTVLEMTPVEAPDSADNSCSGAAFTVDDTPTARSAAHKAQERQEEGVAAVGRASTEVPHETAEGPDPAVIKTTLDEKAGMTSADSHPDRLPVGPAWHRDPRVRDIATSWAHGQHPSNDDLAARFDCSARTARRLRSEARSMLEISGHTPPALPTMNGSPSPATTSR